jgi:hypothetical protein
VNPDSGVVPLPTSSDLAQQIKTLKAANSIDTMPQLAERCRSIAEEPVTARIRRKAAT